MTTSPKPKTPMPWWGGLLIAFGVLAFLGLAAIGGIAWWVTANQDRLLAEAQEAVREGETFASEHDQSECVDEGIRRLSSCGGMMCETQLNIFTSACIREAEPTPGFCDGVPSKGEIMKTSMWVIDECSRRGKANNQRCSRLMQAVPEACHPPDTTE